jgi:hypothetical protein
MHDDTQQLSPTPSDNDRPRPTESDTVRPSPTMSATRTEAHTLTTREVMKMFEAAGIPRAQRSRRVKILEHADSIEVVAKRET